MSAHYKTKGFVLKKDDRGEADQFFTIYTQEFGQQKILARGVRKLNSKLRAEIPLFGFSEIEFVEGRVYKTLTGACLIENFENIKKDLNRLKISYQISETFCELIKPPQKDEHIWQLLSETFNRLNNCSLPAPSAKPFSGFTVHCSLIYYYFLWNLFSVLGYHPELYCCLNCKKKLEPKNLYFSQKGGIICADCFDKMREQKFEEKEFLKIDVDVIKILREILKRDISYILRLKIQKEHQKSLREISNFYLQKGIF